MNLIDFYLMPSMEEAETKTKLDNEEIGLEGISFAKAKELTLKTIAKIKQLFRTIIQKLIKGIMAGINLVIEFFTKKNKWFTQSMNVLDEKDKDELFK